MQVRSFIYTVFLSGYRKKYPEERIKNILGLKGEPLMFMGVGYANEGVEHSRGHNERTFKFNPKRKQPIVTKVWE